MTNLLNELMLTAVAVVGLGIVWTAVFGWQLKRFCDRTPEIRSVQDLEAFKRVVAAQMYAALIQIVILMAPWGIFGYGLLNDRLQMSDAIYLTFPYVLVGIGGLLMKRVEQRAKNLPVSDPDLLRSRDAVVQSWVKRALPDW
jgi:Na+/H+ antiporter NhaC